MTLPALKATADFPATDLTPFGVGDGIRIQRGATSLVTTGFVAEAGAAEMTLDNWGRRFDPNFSTGPYFGSLVPGVSIETVVDWNSIEYALHTGGVDDWTQSYPNNGVDQNVNIRATDAIGFFSGCQFVEERPAESSGARIQAIVDASLWSGATDIDPGVTIVSPLANGVISAWSHMTDVTMSEWGDLYIRPDGSLWGTLVFRDRNRIVTETRSIVSQASYVQSGGLNFSDVTMASLPICNDFTITYNDQGAQVNAQDATSIADIWGLKSQNVSLPLGSRTQAQAYADWFVYLYKNPITTFTSVTFTPSNEPGATFDLWADLFTRELSDLVTVTLDPLDDNGDPSGDPIVRDCWIRGMQFNLQTQPWSVTFALQDASWVSTLARFDVDDFDGPKVFAF